MDNSTIGLIMLDVAMALGFGKLLGFWAGIASLIGSAFFFSFLR